jgi:hypothetical protein
MNVPVPLNASVLHLSRAQLLRNSYNISRSYRHELLGDLIQLVGTSNETYFKSVKCPRGDPHKPPRGG